TSHASSCPENEGECKLDSKCGAKFKLKDMETHMKECSYRLIPCHYEYAGCMWVGQANSLPTHIKENSLDHSLLLERRLNELKKEKIDSELKFTEYKSEEKKKLGEEFTRGSK